MSLPNRSSYLQYKRSTNDLVKWIYTASAECPGHAQPRVGPGGTAITVSTLVFLARLISTYVKAIPAKIYELFQSVIEARKAAHAFYIMSSRNLTDQEVVESNIRHKCFLDALEEAYRLLGGTEWQQKEKEAAKRESQKPNAEGSDAAFLNRFKHLDVDEAQSDGEQGAEEVEKVEPKPSKPPNKGKKKNGKGKSKAKGKGQEPAKRTLDEGPLGNFTLLDEQGVNSDMSIAVWSFITDVAELRDYAQEVWRDVALGVHNAAVAGTMSNVLIGMVKQLQFELAADFPALANFDAVLRLLWEGSEDRQAGPPPADHGAGNQASEMNIKEAFMMNAHQDLVAFVIDFRKQRNGRPTKQMLPRLRWDPNYDLQTASEAERLRWRSAYSINWLYDLVNVYTLPMLARGLPAKPESFDWASLRGCWMLWGTMEIFASDLTTMAMQKLAAPINLLPHHVFAFQLALDSMTGMRGWSRVPASSGIPRLEPPLSTWEECSAAGDIKVFLYGHQGLEAGVGQLLRALDDDRSRRIDGWYCYEPIIYDLAETWEDLQISLGSSPLDLPDEVAEKHIGPTSRFEPRRNGLWEFSPFLCGTGLATALSWAFHLGVEIWDETCAPRNMVHLYNYLSANGHLPEKIKLFEQLIQMFGRSFFAGTDGKPPTENFWPASAWASGVKAEFFSAKNTQRRLRKEKSKYKGKSKRRSGIATFTRFFRDHSLIQLLADNDWIPDKIPDEEVPLKSAAGLYRLRQLYEPSMQLEEQAGRPARKLRIRETALVRRYNTAGLLSPHPNHKADDSGDPLGLSKLDTSNIGYLRNLACSIAEDVNGTNAPYSGLNYLFICAFLHVVSRPLWTAICNLPTTDGVLQMASTHGDVDIRVRALHDVVMHTALMSGLREDKRKQRCDNELLQALGARLWAGIEDMQDGIMNFSHFRLFDWKDGENARVEAQRWKKEKRAIMREWREPRKDAGGGPEGPEGEPRKDADGGPEGPEGSAHSQTT